MGVPTSEVGYIPAMPRREDHEVHKGHVVALEEKKKTQYNNLVLSTKFIKKGLLYILYLIFLLLIFCVKYLMCFNRPIVNRRYPLQHFSFLLLHFFYLMTVKRMTETCSRK
jgi:hypothetical protein